MNYYKSSKKTYETNEEIKELALRYLDKFQPSKKDLRLYLFKKVLNDEQTGTSKSVVLEQIDSVIQNLENLGLINDDIYSEMKSKTYLRRGYSLNKIKMSLSLKGIDPERLKKTIDNIKKENEDPDFYSAIKICKKRRHCVDHLLFKLERGGSNYRIKLFNRWRMDSSIKGILILN